VRVGGFGVGGHEALEGVLAVELLDALDVTGIALVQRLADVGVGLAGQLQAQPVVLGALAPQVVELGLVLRPRGVLAVERVAFIGGEIEALLEQAARKSHALDRALHVQVEYRERCGQVVIPDRVVQRGLQRCEFGQVGLGEEHLLAIEQLEIRGIDPRRHRVVERLRVVVEAGEEARGKLRGLRLVGSGRKRPDGRLAGGAGAEISGRLRKGAGGGEGQQQDQRGTKFHGCSQVDSVTPAACACRSA
jgi:hypothetical protein